MNLKQVTIFMIILTSLVKIAISARESCTISPRTVEIVEKCPDNEEEWTRAAARKNCAAYARYCSNPTEFVYHCVINSYINATLEVCAYKAYIVLGRCTEYSSSGNRIQMNVRTDCYSFSNNPCPLFYMSTKTYKYPGCYELAKKSTSSKENQSADNSTKSFRNIGEVSINTIRRIGIALLKVCLCLVCISICILIVAFLIQVLLKLKRSR